MSYGILIVIEPHGLLPFCPSFFILSFFLSLSCRRCQYIFFVAAHSSRSFDRCLLHRHPPCSALGRFLGRLYSSYSSCTPLVLFSGPVIFLLSAGGYRQISTVTQFQAHPSVFLHWPRGPCSCAAGGSLLTGAILKALSAGGVSGSFGRSIIKPKLSLQGCCPSSQASLSFTTSDS